MHVPPNVNEVFAKFHAGLMYDQFASVEEMIKHALAGTSERQRRAAAAFLVELLRVPREADELQDIWGKTSADIFFPDEQHLISFLKTMREVVER